MIFSGTAECEKNIREEDTVKKLSRILVLVIAIAMLVSSVAFAEALKTHFSQSWDNVTVNHRDIERR